MCTKFFRQYSDWGFLLLRVVIGIIFIYHGSLKWGLWTATPGNMPMSMVLLFKLLSIVEPLAGLALIVGVYTEWAALILSVVMLGAIYFKISVLHMPFAGQSGTGWEFDLILLAGSVVLLTSGGGSLVAMKSK